MSNRELKRIKRKRGRPPIDLEVQQFIATEATKDLSKSRKELAYELIPLIKKKGYPPPEFSTIEKRITEARRNPSPLDQPFNLGALIKHPIPPEALPMVLSVWAGQDVETEDFSYHGSFSIRNALWVSRFSHLPMDPDHIWGYAMWYSVRERAYEAIGKPPDTWGLDMQLLENLKPKEAQNEGKHT